MYSVGGKMIVYLLLFTLIIVLAFFIFMKGVTDRKKMFFLGIAFFLMFLVMGFRTESVGTDTTLYCNIFQNNFSFSLKSIFNDGDTSFLYSLYNKFVSFFSTDRRAIIVSNSLLICFLTSLFIYKNSKNVVFPTLFFMTFYHFFSAMNISRQYIAVMIVANAFYFLRKKKIFKYVTMCTVATLVHNTAIISFIMLPFLFIRSTKKNIYIYLISLTIGMLFVDKIMIAFSSLFSHYGMYFNNNLLTEVGQNRKIIVTFIYIIFAVIITSLLKKNDDMTSVDIDLYLLYMLNFIAIIIGILSLKIMLLSRIEVYFSIFAIILIPKVFDMMKDKIMYYFVFTMVMIIPMYIQLQSNNSEVLPYFNWLFQKYF